MVFYQWRFLSNFIDYIPEILLVLTLILVFIIDLIEENSIWLLKTTLFSLLAATLILGFQSVNPVINHSLSNYSINGLTTIFRYLIVLSATLSLLISEEYIKRSGMPIGEFLIFLLTATIGGVFVSGANDLITLFVALECLSLASYLLAGYSKRDIRSNEASMKYFLTGGASSAILAYGFSWLYGISGGKLVFSDIFLVLSEDNSMKIASTLALICILISISFKLSMVPFHQWSPDVYEGSPTPVVAFFSIGSKTVGLILILRVLTLIFPLLNESTWQPILTIFCILSMVVGNLIAVTQTSMKRLLAYSSISQVGYLSVGIISGINLVYTPLIIYMLIYIFTNMGAFACLIFISLKTGTDQLRDYSGLYFRDPIITVCLTICLLSLAGLPPFAGFFSKLYLFWYAWKNGFYYLVLIGLITSVISIYYYLRIIKIMVSKERQEQSLYIRLYEKEKSFPDNLLEYAIALCVLFSTGLGFCLNPIIDATANTVSLI